MKTSIESLLKALGALCPAGYAIGLHIRFTSPSYLLQTYPEAWNEAYSARGLVMLDPAVAWGLSNVGAQRWSGLAGEDRGGVLTLAAEHGLRYGAAVAAFSAGSRSVAGFARGDREFADDELEQLVEALTDLHGRTADEARISDADRAALRRHS
ncbi:MAG: autoinducer binding domain-containing protein, partial [Pseudomonadota bacterium]